MPITLYGEYSLSAAGQKRKFNREYKPMEDSSGNKKSNPKVEIHDLIKKHFINVIWKVNTSLLFRDLSSFYNVHTSVLSKDDKVCTLGMFQK